VITAHNKLHNNTHMFYRVTGIFACFKFLLQKKFYTFLKATVGKQHGEQIQKQIITAYKMSTFTHYSHCNACYKNKLIAHFQLTSSNNPSYTHQYLVWACIVWIRYVCIS